MDKMYFYLGLILCGTDMLEKELRKVGFSSRKEKYLLHIQPVVESRLENTDSVRWKACYRYGLHIIQDMVCTLPVSLTPFG
ncbi:MAG: hypothetical protein Q4C40_06285 [Eubacteriales bacterium]|nr:hypothetical protein [Eubacteriales bacterium]